MGADKLENFREQMLVLEIRISIKEHMDISAYCE